jgi:hypothetical protein
MQKYAGKYIENMKNMQNNMQNIAVQDNMTFVKEINYAKYAKFVILKKIRNPGLLNRIVWMHSLLTRKTAGRRSGRVNGFFKFTDNLNGSLAAGGA